MSSRSNAASSRAPEAAAPDATRVGAVGLVVADLARSLHFYRAVVGLQVLSSGDGHARLGTGGRTLVDLAERPGAAPALGFTGLFHLALRVPARADLARWLVGATHAGLRLDGAADHWVSEAIYLSDPDGHGIEVYVDRPRSNWDGQVDRMTTLPLDLADLVGVLGDEPPPERAILPPGSDMGHAHLRVADAEAAIDFYRGVIGFELMARYGSRAAFLAAGGYHHHLGVNSWQSRGAAPPPAGSARLRHVTLLFPDLRSREAAQRRVEMAAGGSEAHADGVLVRDPSGNPIVLAVDEAGPAV